MFFWPDINVLIFTLRTGMHLPGLFDCMTDPFALQILSIKADKILNAVSAGL